MSIAIGQRFGSLLVLSLLPKAVGRQMASVRCDCGVTFDVTCHELRSRVSCGCARRKPKKHGATSWRGRPSTEYVIWRGMKARCYNSREPGYANYGGRGITVCARWRNDFAVFLADMGPRPSPKHSIDRIDNAGNYEPGNCRWATKPTQGRNTRRSRVIEFRGVSKNLIDWARDLEIDVTTLIYRLRMWPLERALTQPPHAANNNHRRAQQARASLEGALY